jgi:uncharacterized protein (DUF2267 family)
MSTSGLEAFDATVQKTNLWLKDLMQELHMEDKQKAYLALRAVLHALRDRLTVVEVAQLGAQLPMLVRGFYYEGWDPTGKPLKVRHQEEFLAQIGQEVSGDSPARLASAVFALLARRISDGEIEDVKHVLPAELRNLWP